MGEITRQSLNYTLFFFLLLLLLFWGRSELSPVVTPGVAGGDMPLGTALNRVIGAWPFIATLLAAVMIFWNSVLLVRIVSRNMILTDRSYMPMIIYLLVSAGCYLGSSSLSALIISSLMIYSFDRMLVSFRRVIQYGSLFNSTLLLGIALLIWSHTVVYIPLLVVALVLFKKGWREWIVAWMGLILPLVICSYVYWGMGYSFTYVCVCLWNCLLAVGMPGGFMDVWKHPELMLFGVISLLTIILSQVSFWRRASTIRTRAYKSYIYFLWILLFSALLFVIPGRSVTDLPLLAIPLAIIIPSYFIRNSGWVPNLIYLLMVGSIVVYNLLALLVM